MSEKRHAATPRRRQEARKKGQVLKSQELTSALILLALVGVLKFWIPAMIVRLGEIFPYVLNYSHEWSIQSISALMVNLLGSGLIIMTPILGAGVLVGIALDYLQVRSLFTLEPLKPQLSRISPIAGFKRMFGVRAWVELAKSLAKVILIGYFLYASIRDNMELFPGLITIEFGKGVILLGEITLTLAWKISIAFVLIAVFDLLYQWWDYEKNLRMSQEDLKDEYKLTEGNPELKSEIKKRQRAISMRRMMEDLKKADVVVTNPTHYAVALRYNPKERLEPFVVAKGQDQLALRIRELAKDYDIVIMENKPLARALYTQVEIGQAIPADLYKAVAEVLAFVYRLKKKKAN